MPYKPVDTAIQVILGPAIDDTDFKTREEAIAFNQAGMEVDIILEKYDGTIVTTAVTPTAAGNYDWAHTNQGYYSLELPAAAGASFNNTEEGIITAVAYCTGVLPFRSVSYDIIESQAYDSLVKGTDALQVDIVEVSGDSNAANNLELDYDGTGYVKANSTIGTCTTNTDRVSAASVVNEWETQSQADPTGFHVNVLEVSGTAQTANDIGTGIAGIPTVAEFNARTLLAADYFDPTIDDVAHVTLVDTTTTNTDMRGTELAALATTAVSNETWTNARAAYLDELSALNVPDDIDSLLTRIPNVLSLANINAEVDTALSDVNLDHLLQITLSVNDAAPNTTDFITDSAIATDDWYNGMMLVFSSGALAGLGQFVKDYDGASKRIYLENAMAQAPVDGDTCIIVPISASPSTGASAADIADQVWDELKAGHTIIGSYGHEVTKHGKQLDRNFVWLLY